VWLTRLMNAGETIIRKGNKMTIKIREHDQEAYILYEEKGMKQQDIATFLNNKYKTSYKYCNVSPMITRYGRYIKWGASKINGVALTINDIKQFNGDVNLDALFLTIKCAATYLKTDESTLLDLIHRKEIPYLNVTSKDGSEYAINIPQFYAALRKIALKKSPLSQEELSIPANSLSNTPDLVKELIEE
jgi:excisionase family DNA binding protein